jgi:hypothetical protein
LNRTRREAVTGAPEVNVLNLCNCVFNRIWNRHRSFY